MAISRKTHTDPAHHVPQPRSPVVPDLAPEHPYILNMVAPGSRVLDLGCGEGDLLLALQRERDAHVEGIELSEQCIQSCVEKGLFNVRHGDLDEGLADYEDQSVDYVILTNTIQVLQRPLPLLLEMARVGKNCIVSFPNFAHRSVRLHLLMKGRMPKNHRLPYEWYNSPNIHLTTLADFRDFCRSEGMRIMQEIPLRTQSRRATSRIHVFPNLFADFAVYHIRPEGNRPG